MVLLFEFGLRSVWLVNMLQVFVYGFGMGMLVNHVDLRLCCMLVLALSFGTRCPNSPPPYISLSVGDRRSEISCARFRRVLEFNFQPLHVFITT